VPIPKSAEFKRIQLKQLDERLQPWQQVKDLPRPRDGWVAAVRQALGIGVAQLAHRLGITPGAVVQLEDREVAGTVTLESLRRAAEAVDCKLVYALVPNVSLEHTLRTQVRRIAQQKLGRVGHSMRLEAQEVDDDEAAHQEAALAQRLLMEWSRRIWDDDDPVSGRRGK
jgi:predicted DNA-binding mobile mystery protein A